MIDSRLDPIMDFIMVPGVNNQSPALPGCNCVYREECGERSHACLVECGLVWWGHLWT